MIRSRYSRIIDLSKPCLFSKSFVDCTNLIPVQDLNIPQMLSPPGRAAYQFVTNAITVITESTCYNRELFRNLHYVVVRPLSLTQTEFQYRSKGCSKFYYIQAKEYSRDFIDPPGRTSANLAYGMDINEQRWSNAISKTLKAVTSPSSIDLSYKIFLRQNWTPLKQSLAKNDPDISKCVHCGYENSNTEHIYLNCFAATDIWLLLNRLLSPAFGFRVNVSPEQILFHQNISSFSRSADRVILDLIITCKSILQRIAFRDIHLPLINRHSMKAMFFKATIETIFANKSAERLTSFYHTIYDQLLLQFNPTLPLSFT